MSDNSEKRFKAVTEKVVDDSLDTFTKHLRDHVLFFPVKIKEYHDDCNLCQNEMRRIVKRSDKDTSGVALKGRPSAIISLSTVLCFVGMHEECCKNYVLDSEQIRLQCLCHCHDKENEGKRSTAKNAGTKQAARPRRTTLNRP